MKENLILVNYKVESEAYQALSELKRETSNANYTISQAAIVKKENGTLNIMDGFVNGAMTGDDTWKGSLIGSLVGVLGGPLGVLLGGSMGMLIGGAVDANDMADNASLLEKAGDSILNGETAIILLAQEEYETALTAKLSVAGGLLIPRLLWWAVSSFGPARTAQYISIRCSTTISRSTRLCVIVVVEQLLV